MLKITPFGPVVRYDISRSLIGKGRYWTTAYRTVSPGPYGAVSPGPYGAVSPGPYGGDGLMIDTGCAHAAPELARALADACITCIVNTHSHEDHIGGNALLQRACPGLAIRAHPSALPVLSDPAHAQPLHPYRRLFWGMPMPSHATALQDGEIIETEHYRFNVIFTPGHSPDHLCLYEEEHGWLFSGDLFVGGQDRALRLGQDIWKTIESLRRIAALPAKLLFPGSARVRENPAAELQQRIAYLEELGGQVLALRRQGCAEGEIARRLCGAPMWIEAVTLGHFSRRQLVRAYLHDPRPDL